ncbi:hypothetical protein ACFFX1_55495 [Dactylosporangium sucinum]|uniref:Uncharacterized protein n=1 Tax=Dactylosporangium sucinum TaxID=1424081 RepID=A0A917U2G2_9ACTN|nr:hypothetical protein [Dactylosporangium sucinum]GGM52576.1 hypothetical protein GCM10007977_062650 [Dactylosporangium sucinum]
MPTREEVLDMAWQGTSVERIADLITERAATVDLTATGTGHRLARDILRAFAGTDDEPGLLDRYEVQVIDLKGRPVAVWYCPRCHHVGLIMRDLDGDQSGLTPGEIVQAILGHEGEAH